jgi:conjugal transfer pilus assembly protein TraU
MSNYQTRKLLLALTGLISLALMLLVSTLVPLNANATTCTGKFVNPISDICWSCIFPISLGPVKLNSSSKRDTKNPSSPVCGCVKNNIPIPGITLGFWEPVKLIEATRKPLCLVSMGGLSIGNMRRQGDFSKKYEEDDNHTSSFYHVHYYIYPVIYWLNLITDFGCLEEADMDVAYLSEYDPSHTDDKMANFFSPEVFLMSNPLMNAACGADCVSANISFPQNNLFWCAGCLGNIYPFSGNISTHVGGVQASSLMAIRTLAKLHREGIAKATATSSAGFNGPLCRKSYALKIPKDQYKLQMTYPVANSSGEFSCNPLGMSDLFYGANREFPYKGEDFGYLIWRKRNCCLF